MLYCAGCGTRNPKGSRFCSNCGNEISSPTTLTIEEHGEVCELCLGRGYLINPNFQHNRNNRRGPTHPTYPCPRCNPHRAGKGENILFYIFIVVFLIVAFFIASNILTHL